MAYATWNPADKGPNITLSGGNLTAQETVSGYHSVRSTASASAGKFYWEITLGTTTTVEAVGFANASASVNSTSWLGSTHDSIVMFSNGNIVKNSVIVAAGPGMSSGNVISLAMDFGAGTLGWRRNGGAWTTVSGVNIPAGALFAAVGSGGGLTATMTANFGATAFVYTPPADHVGLQEALDYQHAMLGGLSAGTDTAIHLNPLYISMLGGLSAGGTATVEFTNATRYEHAMLGGLSAGADTSVASPRSYVDAALAVHSLAGAAALAYAISAVLPAHSLVAEFSDPGGLSATLAAHTGAGAAENGTAITLDSALAAHSLDAFSPWHADNVVAAHALSAVGIAGSYSSLDAAVPAHALEASGIGSFFGEMSSAMPAHTVSVSYEAGSIGSADLLYGVAALGATGFSGSVSSIGETLPPHTLVAAGYGPYTAVASLVLVPHTLDAAAAAAITAAFKSWVLNLRKAALTEYTPFQFNSFAVFAGKVYAAGAAGIMELGAQGTDNGTAIAATFRTGQHAFGTSLLKRVPRIYTGYKATGDMEFRTITGENGTRAYLLAHNGNLNLHQRRVPVGLGPKSPYWQFEVVNRDGADFTFDHILAHSAKVTKRRVM